MESCRAAGLEEAANFKLFSPFSMPHGVCVCSQGLLGQAGAGEGLRHESSRALGADHSFCSLLRTKKDERRCMLLPT